MVGASTNDRSGCTDSDGDGWSDPDSGWGVQNGADAFASEPSQWLDSDNDGYGDNLDAFEGDHCQFSRGYSSSDRYGCVDSDGDSYSDPDPGGLNGYEAWFAHPAGKGDAFAYDSSQWNDTDEDGYGDNWDDPSLNASRALWDIGQFVDNASQPDACPFIRGTSFSDRYGCVDTDMDTYSDGDENWTINNGSDAFPLEPTQWLDTDRDGWGDNQTMGAQRIDDFPFNPTQWRDTDEDGWGDNQTYGATQIDDFPFVPSQYRDTDGDGYGDNLPGLRAMSAPLQRQKKLILDGSVGLTDSDVATLTAMDSLTQPTCGLLIRQGSQMPSLTMHRSGTTPMTMVLETTRNTLMAKHGEHRTDQTVVEQPKESPPSPLGLPRRRRRWMVRSHFNVAASPGGTGLGHRIRPMARRRRGWARRQPAEPQRTFARPWRDSVGPSSGETVGAARTRTAMVGQTSVMPSFTNPRNGEIQTATATETDWTAIKGTPVLKRVGLPFWTAWDAEIRTATVGLTQPRPGQPIHSVRRMPSQPRLFNGKTPTKTDSGTCRWVLSETIVLSNRAVRTDLQGCPDGNGDGWSDSTAVGATPMGRTLQPPGLPTA